jgi:hypothetical protein
MNPRTFQDLMFTLQEAAYTFFYDCEQYQEMDIPSLHEIMSFKLKKLVPGFSLEVDWDEASLKIIDKIDTYFKNAVDLSGTEEKFYDANFLKTILYYELYKLTAKYITYP